MRIFKLYFRWMINILAFLSLIMGGAHLLRVRSARGLILRGVKAVDEGLSPFLAVIGMLSAATALWIRAPLSALAGFTGAALQIRYIRHVIRPHQAFEVTFGKDWRIYLANHTTEQQRMALLKQRWAWRMPRPRVRPLWERDMIYHTIPSRDGKPAIDLHCDLWLPPENVPATGVAFLYVHGGAYYTTQKDFGTRAFFRHLAAQGHMAMDINYRLGAEATLIDMLSDVQHAVDWLKDNAELFGADPQKVVLAGGSAGAHLALLAAYTAGDPRLTPPDLQGHDLSVHAAVSYYGVIDLVAAYHRMQMLFRSMVRRPISDSFLDRPMIRRALSAAAWLRGVETRALRDYVCQNQAVLATGLESAMGHLVGGLPDEIPDTYRLMSPLAHAGPNCPPTMLFQGAHDYLLPTSITRKLHSRLQAAGVPCVYVELPQTEHTFDQFLPEISPPAQVALYDLERFLAMIG